MKSAESGRRHSRGPRMAQVWEMCVHVYAHVHMCVHVRGWLSLHGGAPSTQPSCQCGRLWARHLSLSASFSLLSDTLEYSPFSPLLQSSSLKATGSSP